jgi:hypothetical protein
MTMFNPPHPGSILKEDVCHNLPRLTGIFSLKLIFEGSVMMQVKELADEWDDQPYDKWDDCCPYKRNEGVEWAEFHREDLVLDFTSVKARYQILTHKEIAAAWAMKDGLATTYEKFVESENHYVRMIIEAVFAGEIRAEEVSRKFTEDGVWEVIQNTPVGLNNLERDCQMAGDMGVDIYLDVRLSPEAFHSWLVDQKQWPLSDKCLLNKLLKHGHPEPEGQSNKNTSEHDFTKWLRETWINERMLDNKHFFQLLKKYEAKEGSPILQHWSDSPTGAGIRLHKNRKIVKKKTIGTKISKFRNELKQCQELKTAKTPDNSL